jgi:hypothetical protein
MTCLTYRALGMVATFFMNHLPNRPLLRGHALMGLCNRGENTHQITLGTHASLGKSPYDLPEEILFSRMADTTYNHKSFSIGPSG